MKIVVKNEWDLNDLIETIHREFTLYERTQIAARLLEPNEASMQRDRNNQRRDERASFSNSSFRADTENYRGTREPLPEDKDEDRYTDGRDRVRTFPNRHRFNNRFNVRPLRDKSVPIELNLDKMVIMANGEITRVCEKERNKGKFIIDNKYAATIYEAVGAALDVNDVSINPINALIKGVWEEVDDSIEQNSFNFDSSMMRIRILQNSLAAIKRRLSSYTSENVIEETPTNKAIVQLISNIRNHSLEHHAYITVAGDSSEFTWAYAKHHRIENICEIIKNHYSIFNRPEDFFSLDGTRDKDENYGSWNITQVNYVVTATSPAIVLKKIMAPNMFLVIPQNGVPEEILSRIVCGRKTDFFMGFDDEQEAIRYAQSINRK